MSKVVLTVTILFVAFIGLSSPALQRGIAADRNYPGKCYFKDYDRAIAPGGSFTPIGQLCASFECEDSEGFYVQKTCGSIGGSNGCTVTDPDLSKNYPDCCPVLRCN